MQLHATDLRFLAVLLQDSSLTHLELARREHLSPTHELTRFTALESAGVIQRYVELTDPAAWS